jgi:hypothetical protein
MYHERRISDWANAAPESETTGSAILDRKVVFWGFDGQEEIIQSTEL